MDCLQLLKSCYQKPSKVRINFMYIHVYVYVLKCERQEICVKAGDSEVSWEGETNVAGPKSSQLQLKENHLYKIFSYQKLVGINMGRQRGGSITLSL